METLTAAGTPATVAEIFTDADEQHCLARIDGWNAHLQLHPQKGAGNRDLWVELLADIRLARAGVPVKRMRTYLSGVAIDGDPYRSRDTVRLLERMAAYSLLTWEG